MMPMFDGWLLWWAGRLSRSPILLISPTPTPHLPSGQEPVGISGGLFYGLLLAGAVLFLAAFFYGRRKGS